MSKESFHRNNTCAKEISSLGLPSRQVERAASVISLPPVLLKKMKMFFLCRITVLTFSFHCTPPVVHTINCFIVIKERFHCIQHPRRHLVNLKYFSLAELLPRSSYLVEYENIVLTCRTIAYDPGVQLVFVVC